jgi:hypothetical protein
MLSTRHAVDFTYTRQELDALFRYAHEDEGFSLEDLMQELGRLELQALGPVKHGDVAE